MLIMFVARVLNRCPEDGRAGNVNGEGETVEPPLQLRLGLTAEDGAPLLVVAHTCGEEGRWRRR